MKVIEATIDKLYLQLCTHKINGKYAYKILGEDKKHNFDKTNFIFQ